MRMYDDKYLNKIYSRKYFKMKRSLRFKCSGYIKPHQIEMIHLYTTFNELQVFNNVFSIANMYRIN